MKIESVHYGPEGTFINTHPEAELRQRVDRAQVEDEANIAAYQDFLSTAENVNADYADEIAGAQTVFAKDSLRLAPVFVLNDTDYEQAIALGAPADDPKATRAAFLRDRIIVRSNEDAKVLGKDFVLGLILHEGGHGTGEQHPSIFTSKVVAAAQMPEADRRGKNLLPEAKVRMLGRVANNGGFRKYAMTSEGVPESQGEFWEEAFADLTRVRGLKELGREPKLYGRDEIKHGDKVRFVSDETAQNALGTELDTDRVTLPVAFAGAVNLQPDGSVTTYDIPASFASYGLDLLDRHAPGLFQDMQASRTDPAAYRRVIQTINQVRPGLYKELRDLKYTTDDMQKGLRIIQAAVTGQQSLIY